MGPRELKLEHVNLNYSNINHSSLDCHWSVPRRRRRTTPHLWNRSSRQRVKRLDRQIPRWDRRRLKVRSLLVVYWLLCPSLGAFEGGCRNRRCYSGPGYGGCRRRAVWGGSFPGCPGKRNKKNLTEFCIVFPPYCIHYRTPAQHLNMLYKINIT